MSHRTGLARLDLVGNLAGIQKSVSRAEFCKKFNQRYFCFMVVEHSKKLFNFSCALWFLRIGSR